MTARPDQPHVGLVVEGPGDRNALPVLLRKVDERDALHCDCLGKPVTLNGRSNAEKLRGIEGYVATAAGRSGAVGVLVVVDRDKEGDPVTFTEALLERAQAVTAKPVRLVLAEPDYEQWIYASAETLEIGLSAYVEGKRGMKAIKEALAPGKYVKPVWQSKLTSRMDLDLALGRSVDLGELLTKFRELRGLLQG